MRRAKALLALAAMAAVSALALVAPPILALALLAWALLLLPTGRGAFLAFAAVTVAIDAAILAWAARDPLAGALAGVRLSALLGANLAIVGRLGAARLLDGSRLPPRATVLVAAILLAARDVGLDFARLRDARRSDAAWPRGRLGRVREAARLLPALFVHAERRARTRRDALRLAGHPVAPWFVPFVAIAALAAAGRLAFLAMPNVALTYVVVFLGGLLYGAAVGAAGGAAAMLLTDLLLSGLYPLAFVNVPAMALLGLAGGALRRVDWEGGGRVERAAGLVFAFASGALGLLAFSVATDTLTWLVVAPGNAAAWRAIVLGGLAFNAAPAVLNGALFALSVRPVVAAFARLRAAERAPPRAALPASPSSPPVAGPREAPAEPAKA